jgi:hypothetical protein
MRALARTNENGKIQARVRATRRPANAPTSLITDEAQFEYRGYFGCESYCRLRLFRGASKLVVAVATELESNEGTSVTNVAEQLAMFVCDEFQIARSRLVWIEHYPAQRSARGAVEQEEEFSRVNFVVDTRQEFVNATWRALTVHDVAGVTNTDICYWLAADAAAQGEE